LEGENPQAPYPATLRPWSICASTVRGWFWRHDNRGKFVVEPGRIDVYAGDSSTADQTQSFTVSG
jgi:hypothetical protein